MKTNTTVITIKGVADKATHDRIVEAWSKLACNDLADAKFGDQEITFKGSKSQ